jgi:starch synthase
VHITAEIEPFSKSGGLANMVPSLAKFQAELGHDVSVITPYYTKIVTLPELPFLELFNGAKTPIELGTDVSYDAEYLENELTDILPVYFIKNKEFFGSQTKLYGADNENLKYLFFCAAAVELLKKFETPPDIIHCHDWHSGLVPAWIKKQPYADFFKDTATLFTIHNLVFQLGHNWWEVPETYRDTGRTALPHPTDTKYLEGINFAKRAILSVDAINTVSESYREEILTKDFGEDLHVILKNREDHVFGIVNGIDYNDYNPLTDAGIAQHFSEKSIERKKANKKWLQEKYGLPVLEDVAVLCMTSRISEQKGFILLIELLPQLLQSDVQCIIMGNGDQGLISELTKIQKQFPDKLVIIPFDSQLETSVYAGSDIFILPSRFEPCGINQMIAMRYGCVPVVHHIGGLADTVINFKPEKKRNKGNGFSFKKYDYLNLLIALTRALETYKHKEIWKELVVSDLMTANSWEIPAKKYIELYKKTIKLKVQKNEQ